MALGRAGGRGFGHSGEMIRAAAKRRTAGLVVRDVAADTIVYDLTAEHIWMLDTDTAAVWTACDGARDLATVAAVTGLPDEKVAIAMQRLFDADLVLTDASTRRRFLTAAAAATLTPLVGIAAPSAAAASSVPPGNPQFSHDCSGAHVVRVVMRLSGLPGTIVRVTYSVNGGSFQVQDLPVALGGTAQLVLTFPSTGKPVAYDVRVVITDATGLQQSASYQAVCP